MAELKKIEILCIPCHKCEVIKEKIQAILKCLEFINGRHINCEVIFYETRKEGIKAGNRLGYSVNQFPVTFVNGELAFIGSTISEQNIRRILENFLKY